VTTIPSTIPDLGNAALLPTPNPGFDPGHHAERLSAEDYFVFTRIDGASTLRQIILETGFDVDRAIEILRKLRALGAFLLPGETEPPVMAMPEPPAARPADAPARAESGRTAAAAPPEQSPPSERVEPVPRAVPAMGTVRLDKPLARPPSPDPARPERPLARGTDQSEVNPSLLLDELDLADEEVAALEEEVALTPAQKASLLVLRRHVADGDYFALLDVDQKITKRELKRAYFRVSKQFHPDRFYGKNLGSWAPWLSEIFEAASRAFDVLSDERRRREYVAVRNGESRSAVAVPSQSREEHATELFDQACTLELRGDYDDALRLFSAVVRMQPQPRFLQRAARCSLAAGQLDSAEEYAKKAAELRPNDPSCGRLLASVYSAAGNLAEAERTLLHSLSLITENDVLVGELQSDLATVRRRLESGSGKQD